MYVYSCGQNLARYLMVIRGIGFNELIDNIKGCLINISYHVKGGGDPPPYWQDNIWKLDSDLK